LEGVRKDSNSSKGQRTRSMLRFPEHTRLTKTASEASELRTHDEMHKKIADIEVWSVLSMKPGFKSLRGHHMKGDG
jgi:hypothetical protein